jgi:hypothetical protein
MHKIDTSIKSSFKQMPVMITGIRLTWNGNRYRICTKYKYLKGTYDRNDLVPRKGHTAEMQDINDQCSEFWKQMSIQDACNAYANMEHCNCKGKTARL